VDVSEIVWQRGPLTTDSKTFSERVAGRSSNCPHRIRNVFGCPRLAGHNASNSPNAADYGAVGFCAALSIGRRNRSRLTLPRHFVRKSSQQFISCILENFRISATIIPFQKPHIYGRASIIYQQLHDIV
jgi:hypothetical protein